MKAILGEKFVQLFCPFSIDKLCEMWYNGKFGASRSWAPRSRQNQRARVAPRSKRFAFAYKVFCGIHIQNRFCFGTLCLGFAIDIE